MDESPPRTPKAASPTAQEPPDPGPAAQPTPPSTSELADELRVRVVEAQTALDAAQVLDEPLIAQIAEADLADLRALAARNDVDLDDVGL